MENIALIESFSEFKDDKLIDRVTLMAILEDVFRNALKKKFGSDDNFDIIINPDKGDMEIWRNRVVVADGEVEDDNQEISLYTQPIPEPPCVLLRWRFLVQAQFYTHMGYTLHIEQHQENTSSTDTIEIKNV